uniref:Exonuclease 1 n=1 Tax=Photinus pyralis TaxID=7054 RepID=A0A1Y1LQK6_PHOPY
MGISGLLPFLESASKKCYINEFRGLTVAIDSYCWLHKGTFSCADKLVRGEPTDAYVKYCFKYINLLRSYNIKPILVFDGQHLPAKKETERRRREHRLHARNRATELLRLGKVEEARQYLRQSVNITHEMALALIKECRKNKIDCIVAPYEADAQLAYLNRCGIADVVITEDSDLILFGCSKIFFKFNLDGSGVLVEHNKLITAMKMRPDQYTFDKFRYMCIISGCDYLDSLPGIGLKKAHKAVLLTHNPDIYKVLTFLQLHSVLWHRIGKVII